jgi:MBG domain (YGX type)/Divergent InlB B-repeat domain
MFSQRVPPIRSVRRACTQFASALIAFLAIAIISSSALGEQAVSADSFVDTAGVNIHLSWIGTAYYDDYPAVLKALQDLGVRHVRDGISDLGTDPNAFYYQRHDDLAKSGITTIYNAPMNEQASVLLAYPGLVKDFEGYEGPNEYDASGDPNWPSTLSAYQTFLYHTVKGNASTAKYPVLAPALANKASWPQVYGMSSSIDFGNLHNYYSGYNPGTTTSAGIASWVQALRAGWSSVPIITTETGYIYQTFEHVVGPVAGTYLPRVFLEQYLNGIRRTYIYELIDKDTTEFGLMEANMTPRPAYTAMASLLNLLSDPGPPFTPASLAYTVSGNTANIHRLLMQKRDGSFYLALWIESQDYDQVNQQYLSVPNQAITLAIQGATYTPVVHQFDSSGNVSTNTLAGGSSFALNVSPNVMIVQLTPGGSATTTLTTSATPAAGGSISVSPASANGVYQSTQTVTITASKRAGYTFAGFTGDLSGTAPQQTLAMTRNRQVTAVFSCDYILSASSLELPATAGTATVTATTGSGCVWGATSNANWLTPAAGRTGIGSITLKYTANTGAARKATVVAGGQALAFTQAAGKAVSSTGTANQKITFPAIATQVYGVGLLSLNARANSGLVVHYTVTGPAALSGSTLVIKGAGTVAVTAQQPGNAKYRAAQPVTVTFQVSKAPLAVTAVNATRVVNTANPTLTYTLRGLVEGDTAAAVTGKPDLSTPAVSTSPVGTYPIVVTVAGMSAANYTLKRVNGTLTVTQTAAPPPSPVASENADFSLSAGSTLQSVSWGGAATFALNVTPVAGQPTVNFKAVSLPQGFSASFSPSTIDLTHPSTVQFVIRTPSGMASAQRVVDSGRNGGSSSGLSSSAGAMTAMAFMPLLGLRRRRKTRLQKASLYGVAAGLLFAAMALGLTGCGFHANSQGFDIPIAASSSTTQHTITLHLTIAGQ